MFHTRLWRTAVVFAVNTHSLCDLQPVSKNIWLWMLQLKWPSHERTLRFDRYRVGRREHAQRRLGASHCCWATATPAVTSGSRRQGRGGKKSLFTRYVSLFQNKVLALNQAAAHKTTIVSLPEWNIMLPWKRRVKLGHRAQDFSSIFLSLLCLYVSLPDRLWPHTAWYRLVALWKVSSKLGQSSNDLNFEQSGRGKNPSGELR